MVVSLVVSSHRNGRCTKLGPYLIVLVHKSKTKIMVDAPVQDIVAVCKVLCFAVFIVSKNSHAKGERIYAPVVGSAVVG